MKRLLAICLILAALILPVQASIIWDNASGTLTHPVLWTSEGCNISTKTTITLDEVHVGAASTAKLAGSGYIDGEGHLYYTNAYITDFDALTATPYDTLAMVRDSGDAYYQRYYATCDPNYAIENYPANTPATAHYIPSGSYIKFGSFTSAGTAISDNNMSWNGSSADFYDNVNTPVFVFNGLKVDGENAWIKDNLDVYHYFTTTPPGQPIADFNGTPREGQGPLQVLFTDESTNNTATAWNWSTSPSDGVFMYPPAGLSKDVQMIFQQNGNYTITHGVTNPYGSDIETKADYIWVYNATNLYTTNFNAVDLANGYNILGANISLNDVENGTWVNSTLDADGTLTISTLVGHTINAYAEAFGYSDGETLGYVVEFNGIWESIYLQPSGVYNNTEGNLTLHVRVEDGDTLQPISGAEVSATPTSGYGIFKNTNAQGIVDFTVYNNTVYRVTSTKAGYNNGVQMLNTGIASGGSTVYPLTVLMYKTTVTPTITETTGPGGATPAPTIDPYPCVGDGSYQDTLNCQRKQSEMGADVIQYGPMLIQLGILALIIGLAKIMGKK